MEKNNNSSLPQGVMRVNIDCWEDERGTLFVTENQRLPFDIKRVFWITGVPAGQSRGGHAHQVCAEVIIPIQGSLDIEVESDGKTETHHLDTPTQGLYLGPRVWCHLHNFSPDAICLVFASHTYIKEAYINDKSELTTPD